jgi:ATP-dependent RNA helicase DeaD
MKFSALHLSKQTLQALEDMEFTKMTQIQEQAIPILLKGRDLIGQADTGTGKTAAFAIPAIEQLKDDTKEIQVLVLCPTRELACQVADQFTQLMKYREGFTCVPIYGGQKISIQLKLIKNYPQVIVGTPGRVLDHVRQGSLRLRSVRMVILDEADKMLEMGFKDDIEQVVKSTPNRKQTCLFSATMQPIILELAKKYQNTAQHINLVKNKEEELKIKQIYCEVAQDLKVEAIKRLLAFYRVRSALIFCNTRTQVNSVFDRLKEAGFSVASLHGDLEQRKRDAVMRKFRDGEARILVATDIAARGIDVDDIEVVINYSLPRDSQDYVHRIGRTGRAGKTGMAFSLVVPFELKHLKEIITQQKLAIHRESIPSIRSLNISSLEVLQNVLIDSTISMSTSKQFMKDIKKIQAEATEADDVVDLFMKKLLQKKTNVFGAGFEVITH